MAKDPKKKGLPQSSTTANNASRRSNAAAGLKPTANGRSVVPALSASSADNKATATTNQQQQEAPPPPPSVAAVASSSDDDTTDDSSDAPPPTVQTVRQRRQRPHTSSGGQVLAVVAVVAARSVLLDLTLAVLFAILVSTTLLVRVKDEYLVPQLSTMRWKKSRRRGEMTYYNRECELEDMSTRSVSDLSIGTNFTAEDCFDHMMVHGASLYRSILTPQTASTLRDYVLRRNDEIPKEEQIYVIENKNRWSFGVGANDDWIVGKALREIATHAVLRPALDRIAGYDPALIEMTAITSSYGADDQFWHTDTLPKGNSLMYGRTFVPSYSLFIPLQDTTSDMGATEICPGTQYCHDGDAEDFCDEHGFQVSGRVEEGGVWRRGDAVLSNQHTYHRGTAHTAEDGPKRVLFILTFAPRPSTGGGGGGSGSGNPESRMIGQGGSYSLRWDMWGHTLRDLEDAGRNMGRPWSVLRSLGLYKKPGSRWGWDFVSIVSMRIINSDVGYSEDDFEAFHERGGLRFLPKFITKSASDEGWAEYLEDVLEACQDLLVTANKLILLVYLVAVALVTLLQYVRRSKSSANTGHQRCLVIRGALSRLAFTHGAIALIGYLTLRHISQTAWATDIKLGRHMNSAFSGIKADAKVLKAAATRPVKSDILFGIRYDGENYGSMNRFLDYHPGNRAYRAAISDFSGTPARLERPLFRDLPSTIQDRIVGTILGEMIRDGRRFLLQNDAGLWAEMSQLEARDVITKALLRAENALLRALDTKVALMLAKARYGSLRSTALGQRLVPVLLNNWRQKLFSLEGFGPDDGRSASSRLGRSIILAEKRGSSNTGKVQQRTFRVMSPHLDASLKKVINRRHPPILTPSDTRSNLCDREGYVHADAEEQSAFPPKVGNVVDAQYRGVDDDESAEQQSAFIPKVGDIVDAQYEGVYDEWYKGTILNVGDDGRYDVLYDDGDKDTKLPLRSLREYKPIRLGELIQAIEPGTQNSWARAVVKSVRENGTYNLKFANGKKGKAVPVTAIRRQYDWKFREGDAVECKFRGIGSQYYPGVISKARPDGTYDINYSDGDKDSSLSKEVIIFSWAVGSSEQ